jgi:hypothetical protein
MIMVSDFFKIKDASGMNICNELNMLWITEWMYGLYKVNMPWYEKIQR